MTPTLSPQPHTHTHTVESHSSFSLSCMSSQERHVAQPSVRTRPLQVTCFAVNRWLGELPTHLHTDVRTLLMKFVRDASGKGKTIELSSERISAVDAALRAGGVFSGVAHLHQAVDQWKTESRLEADATGINKYYDEWRSEGYDRDLVVAQRTLTLRCFELTGIDPMCSSPFVLDLGCGSGLSMSPLAERGCIGCIGIDLSIEMLRVARRRGAEVVQVDISQPLPFRKGCFDAMTSTSAIQFLCEPVGGRTPEERLASLFSESRRILSHSEEAQPPAQSDPARRRSPPPRSLVAQFHPADPAVDPNRIATAAHANGFECTALILDQPHHTNGRRWFLFAAPRPTSTPSPRETRPPYCCALHAPHRAACLFTLRDWMAVNGLASPRIHPDHDEWLLSEHMRQAHRWLRLLRRVEATEAEQQQQQQQQQQQHMEQSHQEDSGAGSAQQAQAKGIQKGRKRKNKGFLAPGGAGADSVENAMNEAERRAATQLRAALGVEPGGASPSLEELRSRSDDVLRALHTMWN